MSVIDLAAALEIRLKSNWTRTPIKWPNLPFKPPEDISHNPQPYIAFMLRTGPDAEDIMLGSDNPEYRFRGLVIISIFTVENTGTALARLYANLIKDIFLVSPRDFVYLNSGIIRLLVPQILEIGTVEGWYQVNVLIPYWNDFRL